MIALVGAGPGRVDLLTLRAARLISQAGAILHDRLVSPEILALARPHCELIDVGKEEGTQEATQSRILELLEECARRHRLVVRLKGGDPMVFGRGGEEWAYLAQRGWEVEIVPGISSALALPALAGIPPTFRGIAGGFAVITGHAQGGLNEQLSRYAQAETLIVLMGVKQRAAIAEALIAAGRPASEPACFIENGATPRERILVTTLGALGSAEVKAPAVLVIGRVVELHASILPRLTSAVA